MSSPPLRGTAEWSANREVALLLGLTGGNRYAAQQLWLRKERIIQGGGLAICECRISAGKPAACRLPSRAGSCLGTGRAQAEDGRPARPESARLEAPQPEAPR